MPNGCIKSLLSFVKDELQDNLAWRTRGVPRCLCSSHDRIAQVAATPPQTPEPHSSLPPNYSSLPVLTPPASFIHGCGGGAGLLPTRRGNLGRLHQGHAGPRLALWQRPQLHHRSGG
jgi:hypothetical protein